MNLKSEQLTTGLEIAVIGISCNFHNIHNHHDLWSVLIGNEEPIGLTINHSDNNYINVKPLHPRRDLFDHNFFGFSTSEATILSPQLRIMYEEVWKLFEDAGYLPRSHKERIGIFCGSSPTFESELSSLLMQSATQLDIFDSTLLTDRTYIATSLAYFYNLTGPAVFVDSACSTSLTALHYACQSLISGDCDMAIAGAVTILQKDYNGYQYQDNMIYSKDGHTRSFDNNATGTINSEGSALVLLKPLELAIQDQDHIYSIIKGSAINNDGRNKVGYTASSIDAQEKLIKSTILVSDVDPETISFIEAHGSATIMGDPIEIEGIIKGYQTDRRRELLKIGSIKSNLGHTIHVAGIAGFIKASLALYNRLLPASINFSSPNNAVNFSKVNIEVCSSNSDLCANKLNNAIRCGVNSFGIGGTNVHVILEEYKYNRMDRIRDTSCLIIVSAKSKLSLQKNIDEVKEFINNYPDRVNNLAYMLAAKREHFQFRAGLIWSNKLALKDLSFKTSNEKAVKVVFVHPGLGSEYYDMFNILYKDENIFKDSVDYCCKICNELLDFDLIKNLLSKFESEDINLLQLRAFIFSYSYSKLLIYWGISPAYNLGYSFGEYVSAVLEGIITLEDAFKIIIFRGKLIAKTPKAKMLSIPLGVDAVKQLLIDDSYSIAIDNGESCIITGEDTVIEKIRISLQDSHILTFELDAEYGIHSHLMVPIQEDFKNHLEQYTFNKIDKKYLSSVVGGWTNASNIAEKEYWTNHLTNVMQFSSALSRLEQEEFVLVLTSPDKQYQALISRNNFESSKNIKLMSFGTVKENSEREAILWQILSIWLSGLNINWENYFKNKNVQKISPPTYNFEDSRVSCLSVNELLSQYIKNKIGDLTTSYDGEVTSGTSANIEYLQRDTRASLSTPYIAPACKLETDLVNIWSSFFNIDRIGVEDNFIELGGNSLKAIRLIKLINDRIEVKLELKQFMKLLNIKNIVMFLDNKNLPISSINKKIIPIDAIDFELDEYSKYIGWANQVYKTSFSNQIFLKFNSDFFRSIPDLKQGILDIIHYLKIDELTLKLNHYFQSKDILVRLDKSCFKEEHLKEDYSELIIQRELNSLKNSNNIIIFKILTFTDNSFALIVHAPAQFFDGYSIGIILNTLNFYSKNGNNPVSLFIKDDYFAIKHNSLQQIQIKNSLVNYIKENNQKQFHVLENKISFSAEQINNLSQVSKSTNNTINGILTALIRYALMLIPKIERGHIGLMATNRDNETIIAIGSLIKLKFIEITPTLDFTFNQLKILTKETTELIYKEDSEYSYLNESNLEILDKLIIIQFHEISLIEKDEGIFTKYLQYSKFSTDHLPFGAKFDIVVNGEESISLNLSVNKHVVDERFIFLFNSALTKIFQML